MQRPRFEYDERYDRLREYLKDTLKCERHQKATLETAVANLERSQRAYGEAVFDRQQAEDDLARAEVEFDRRIAEDAGAAGYTRDIRKMAKTLYEGTDWPPVTDLSKVGIFPCIHTAACETAWDNQRAEGTLSVVHWDATRYVEKTAGVDTIEEAIAIVGEVVQSATLELLRKATAVAS